jgi:hypothetical protein
LTGSPKTEASKVSASQSRGKSRERISKVLRNDSCKLVVFAQKKYPGKKEKSKETR